MANVEEWHDQDVSSPVSTAREVTPSSPNLSTATTPPSPTSTVMTPSSPTPPESVHPENTPADPTCAPVTKEMANLNRVIFRNLRLAAALDDVEANRLALAHACESTDLLQAYAYIKERRYNQALITARSYRISMLKARKKVDDAVQDLKHFRSLAQANHPMPVNYGNGRSTVDLVAVPSIY